MRIIGSTYTFLLCKKWFIFLCVSFIFKFIIFTDLFVFRSDVKILKITLRTDRISIIKIIDINQVTMFIDMF